MFILALLILHAMYNGLPISVKNLHTKMPWRHKHKSSDLVFLILSSFFLFFPFHYYIPSLVSAYYSFLSQSLLSSLSPSYSILLPLPPSSTYSPQSKQSSSYSDRDTTEDDSESLEDMDFLSRQKKLQAEAKLALAMAKPMAKMQVEVEKQNRKKSPVADLVSTRLTQLHYKNLCKWNGRSDYRVL